MKLIIDKSSKYLVKVLLVMLPMLIVPIVSYDIFIGMFKHYTVIYGSMTVGAMIGIIILLVSDKIKLKK